MHWKDESQIAVNTRHYSKKHGALRALLGGIGTGNISLDTCGALQDFEIFGHPDRGLKLPYCFYSMWYHLEDGTQDSMVLEAQPAPENIRPLFPSGSLMGLKRFADCDFTCQYPFYRIAFEQGQEPLKVNLEAYTPFIPLDSRWSGIPLFQCKYTVENTSNQQAEVSIAGSLFNACGFRAFDGFDYLEQSGERYSEVCSVPGVRGVQLGVRQLEPGDVANGTMAIACMGENISEKPHWQFGGWWDGAEAFWREFSQTGCLSPSVQGPEKPIEEERFVASVAQKKKIPAGGRESFTFITAWNFPNRKGWWPDGHVNPALAGEHAQIFRNYYSTIWKDAWSAVTDFAAHQQKVEEKSRCFADALYSSSLGTDVVEELVSSITVLRSCTCFRIEDGTFFGWEGCFEHAGSCAGNCTHVWNYAQTLAFLFPDLERSMRETEFLVETDESGCMAFRAKRRLEGRPWVKEPAADGQLGAILRVYREWKFSGDGEFLEKLWPKVAKALDFSIRYWDRDGDGVLDGRQHNTYDIEFYGLTSLTNSLFFAALRAGTEMAKAMGENELAMRWQKLWETGSAKLDKALWNGEYYAQCSEQDCIHEIPYQYGNGCISDQVFGQQLASLYGLGDILPKAHVRKALQSIYCYNFQKNLHGKGGIQRNFGNGTEAGLLLCTWPHGGRPDQPFVYSDEVWTGIELQVAVHFLLEGMLEEAMQIVKAIRERYNGITRSPYDEVECGYHYVRSMAAWGLLIAMSGFRFDLTKNEFSFSPLEKSKDFQCFYSTGKEWGIYRRNSSGNEVIQKLYSVLEQ